MKITCRTRHSGTRSVTRHSWKKVMPALPGPLSTKTRPAACATRPAPPEIRRGVLYSHRSNVLHGMMTVAGDAAVHEEFRSHYAGRSHVPRKCLVAGVFHAPWPERRWSMPGGQMDGESIYELLDTEQGQDDCGGADGPGSCFCSISRHPAGSFHISSVSLSGGSACPQSMMDAFERDYGRRGDPRLGHD